jgi:uroporphyrinogen-III synthase
MVDGIGIRDGQTTPLSGRSVVVTRAVEQAAGFAAPLQTLGAEVLVMPVISIVAPEDWGPADDAIERLDAYDWVVVTSTNGVNALDERMHLHGLHIGDLACKKIAVVGSATAARLRELGVEPTIVPERFRAEGLVAELERVGPSAGRRVLLVRAAEAREVLPEGLRRLGFEVDTVPVYRVTTAVPPADVLDRLENGTIDAVVFASGGTARRFVEVLADFGMEAREVLVGPVVASIGPVTTEVLHGLGIAVDVQADAATADAVVRALTDRFSETCR